MNVLLALLEEPVIWGSHRNLNTCDVMFVHVQCVVLKREWCLMDSCSGRKCFMCNVEISQSFPRRFPLIVLVFLGESDVCKYIKLLMHDGNLYDPFLSWFLRVFLFENLPDDRETSTWKSWNALYLVLLHLLMWYWNKSL